MVLSAIEAAAIGRLDGAAMLDRTVGWATINSGTGNLAGLTTMAERLGDACAALPGPVELIDPAPVERIGADGALQPVAHGRHLRLTVRPEAPVQLLLTGHMDTVYAADHPFQTVVPERDGRVTGPGVADMKGGLAVMFAALAAVETTPAADRLGYQIIVNSDEETGSLSSAGLIAEAARGKAAALTFEPALADGTLAGARGGSGNFSIVVRGRSAHAGRNPDEGRNAIVAAADLAVRLSRACGPRLSINPARIDGGGPNNVVPALAILHVNFRPATTDDEIRARAHLDSAIAMVSAEHGVTIEPHGGFNRPPKPIDEASARLFDLVTEAGLALGQRIDRRATGGVCDGNNIAAAGVPVVDTMGVRGGAIHSADEFLVVDSLVERAALAAVTILRIAERGRA